MLTRVYLKQRTREIPRNINGRENLLRTASWGDPPNQVLLHVYPRVRAREIPARRINIHPSPNLPKVGRRVDARIITSARIFPPSCTREILAGFYVT